MYGFGKHDITVTAEQKQLLQSRTFSIRPLSTVGNLSSWKLVGLIWQPIAAYVFTLLVLVATDIRYSGESLDSFILFVGLALIFAYPAIALGLLIFGVVAARLHARVRWSAALYWMYWPFWRFAMCCVAVAVASSIGNYLWFHNFYPHERYQRLQAYSGVDPATTFGVRLMDAGIVTFDPSAGVDRSRTACLKNGATYCIAPIVKNGIVPQPTEAEPYDDNIYDLFMVGLDCCSCPGEFRCGDWNIPATPGGLRLLDQEAMKFYSLASQDWATSYKKKVVRPVFFQWTADPLHSYQALTGRGFRFLALALLLVPAGMLLLAMLLNGALYLLCDAGLATTLSAPLPQSKVGRMLSARFLPDIYKNQEELRSQQQSRLAPDPKYVIL